MTTHHAKYHQNGSHTITPVSPATKFPRDKYQSKPDAEFRQPFHGHNSKTRFDDCTNLSSPKPPIETMWPSSGRSSSLCLSCRRSDIIARAMFQATPHDAALVDFIIDDTFLASLQLASIRLTLTT